MSTPLDRTRPPAPGALRPFHFPPVHRRRLRNGLTLLVCEMRSFPVVTFDMVLFAGGTADPADRGGAALLTAGLLESGAGDRDAAALAEVIDGLGMSTDSGVSWDTTQIGFTALRSRMAEALAVHADLVRRPRFPAAEVERLRDERLASLTQNRHDPSGLAAEVFNAWTFAPDSVYGRPLGGTRASASALSHADVLAFHAERYRPEGAGLVVAGDVTADEVEALVERCYGDWEGAPPVHAPPSAAPRLAETQVIVAHRPGAVQSEVRVGHVGLERTAPDYPAALVLNAILGGLFSSRINLNLRERLGYTYGVSTAFGARRQPGTFAVSAAIKTEGTAHSVQEILRDLREVQQSPVTAAELDDARSYLAGVFPLQLQTTDGVAGRLNTSFTYGLPDDYWQTYRDRILAVTAEDVLQVARTRLWPDRAVVVVSADAGQVRGPLEALGLGPVTVVTADQLP